MLAAVTPLAEAPFPLCHECRSPRVKALASAVDADASGADVGAASNAQLASMPRRRYFTAAHLRRADF